MCGIFAYLNYSTPKSRREIIETLIKGLQRLEYRGYDSAGIGVDSPKSDGMCLIKKSGKVKALEKEIAAMELDFDTIHETHVGISHTRWATHGPPNEVNSHPHRSDENNEFIVVHNGIVTNYKDIKKFLENKSYKFESDTDTEIIAKLIKHIYTQHPDYSFRELVEQVIQQLEGAFSLCFKSVHFPGECVATRRGSPLLIGIKAGKTYLTQNYIPVLYSKDHRRIGRDEVAVLSSRSSTTDCRPSSEGSGIEYFFASDASAIIEHTNRVIILEDDDVAAVRDGFLNLYRLKHTLDDSHGREIITLKLEIQQITKGSFDSFMQKEIFEQPESVVNTMRGRVNFETGTVVLGGIKTYIPEIRRSRRLLLIGCGTSYLAAIGTRQLLEELTELPVMVERASDFLDRKTPVFRNDVCIFISQSGETADTLLALRYCKSRGSLALGVTNTVGSSISRESHCGIHINAGPEIGVGSTKAYTSQLISLVMFALVMCEDRISVQQRRSEIIDGLRQLSDHIRQVLAEDNKVAELAKDLHLHKSMLVMGRGYNYATCLEGALKIKEVAYMHSEGLLANEINPRLLPLIDGRMPIIVIATRDPVFPKCLKTLQQVAAQQGRPIVICDRGDVETQKYASQFIEIPHTVDCLQGVLTIVPMQLLTYHIAMLRGCNVDCPRNLAKSVTVE